jgi:hypothetical protein
MKGSLFLHNELIGEVDLEIIDSSMGAVGGKLTCTTNYDKFQNQIQRFCSEKGIANSNDLPFVIFVNNNIKLMPQGGIGVTDVKGFDEVHVDAAGLDLDSINELLL